MIPSFSYPNFIEILIISILFAFNSSLQIDAMRVLPVSRKRNITVLDEFDSQMNRIAPRKLRRLPHIFSKVLELPFRSDADVSIEETADCIRFVTEIEDFDFAGVGNNVRAHAVEIHPGVTKIVIRNGEIGDLLLEQLKVDVWRFRLPASARPELATAVFVDGELIVTVPKSEGVGDFRDGNGVLGGMERLIFVQ